MPTKPLPVIDMDVIGELRTVGGSTELLQRILVLFAEHAPLAMKRVKEQVAVEDMPELADAVHALKSICGNLGARRVVVLCEEIERMARGGISFDPAAKAEVLALEVELALRTAARLRES
jgi:HPt (histidine-containing phosphotransfer) domain-containing protein